MRNETYLLESYETEISECKTVSDYDEILKELADSLLEENYLLEQNKLEK